MIPHEFPRTIKEIGDVAVFGYSAAAVFDLANGVLTVLSIGWLLMRMYGFVMDRIDKQRP